jgi:predicted dithiol-disulfide oxidoreductase (DUF899 family)
VNVGTREEWLAARTALLAEEKELTRRSDELARTRQELPWVEVDKGLRLRDRRRAEDVGRAVRRTPAAPRLPLHVRPDCRRLAGRRCVGCSYTADSLDGAVVHLPPRGATFVAVSRAPLENLLAYRQRMGWSFRWVSQGDSDFNLDFAVFTEEERRTGTGFNFGTPKHAAEIDLRRDELHGLSAFALETGRLPHLLVL